jgi:hypothetical protein
MLWPNTGIFLFFLLKEIGGVNKQVESRQSYPCNMYIGQSRQDTRPYWSTSFGHRARKLPLGNRWPRRDNQLNNTSRTHSGSSRSGCRAHTVPLAHKHRSRKCPLFAHCPRIAPLLRAIILCHAMSYVHTTKNKLSNTTLNMMIFSITDFNCHARY